MVTQFYRSLSSSPKPRKSLYFSPARNVIHIIVNLLTKLFRGKRRPAYVLAFWLPVAVLLIYIPVHLTLVRQETERLAVQNESARLADARAAQARADHDRQITAENERIRLAQEVKAEQDRRQREIEAKRAAALATG